MKSVVVVLLCLFAVVSCAALMSPRPPSARPATRVPRPAAPPSCDGAIAEVLVERDQCQAELRTVVKTKVETVEKQGAPKRCGGAPPEIEAVASSECAPGMLCLDTKAQAALSANLLAYRAWIDKVRDCERGAR